MITDKPRPYKIFSSQFFLVDPIGIGNYRIAVLRRWALITPVYRSCVGWSCRDILCFRIYWGTN